MSKILKAKQDFWQVDNTRKSPAGEANMSKVQGAGRSITYSKTGDYLHQCSGQRLRVRLNEF